MMIFGRPGLIPGTVNGNPAEVTQAAMTEADQRTLRWACACNRDVNFACVFRKAGGKAALEALADYAAPAPAPA